MLALPVASSPFLLETDSSAYQICVTLLQQRDDHNPRSCAMIRYWSRSFTDVQRRFYASERECVAVLRSIFTLHSYVDGTWLTIRLDHNALRWLMSVDDPNVRLMFWRLRLSPFDFTNIHLPRRKHHVPDAASRLRLDNDPSFLSEEDEIQTFEVATVHPVYTRSARHDIPALPDEEVDDLLNDPARAGDGNYQLRSGHRLGCPHRS